MALEEAKERLVRLLGQDSNSVIALSGKWGTGKTYLWHEVKDASDDEKVKSAFYVSLFGLSNMDQVKRKLIESAIPGVESHGGVFDGIKSLFNAGVGHAAGGGHEAGHGRGFRRCNTRYGNRHAASVYAADD